MIRFLVFALGFFGLLIGATLSLFTKEELKPGRKYFILLEKALLLAVSLVIVFYVKDFFVFFVLGFFAGFVFRRIYFYLGLALPLTLGSFLILLSSLIFVFGMPHGTLIAGELKKRKKIVKEMVFSGIFFFVAILLAYFSGYKPLLMVASGALIAIAALGFKKR